MTFQNAVRQLKNLQARILADTRILEAQLTVDDLDLNAPPTKDWRTAHTFYWKGLQWISGSTRLSPAGFQLGHSVRNSYRVIFCLHVLILHDRGSAWRATRDLALTLRPASTLGQHALRSG